MKKKILSLLMAVLMVVLMLPVQALADGAETTEEYVYISISDDAKYVRAKTDDTIMTHVPVLLSEVSQIDLDDYGLSDYKYDVNGDVITEPTVLKLYVYVHEKFFGEGSGRTLGGYVKGGSGRAYLNWFWDHDCNLNYYVNGEFPIENEGWGATCDRITINPGDFVDIIMFTSGAFWGDQAAAGFHYFTDETGDEINLESPHILHKTTVTANEENNFTILRAYNDLMVGGPTYYNLEENGAVIYYSQDKNGLSTGIGNSVTADENGKFSITFTEEGTWYVWMDGMYGFEYSTDIVSGPAYMEVTVESSEPEGGDEGGNEGGDEPGDEKPEITTGIHGDTNNNRKVEVNMTISEGIDDFYTTYKTQTNFFYEQMSVPYFDLALYDLEAFYYNPDCYSGGTQQAGNKYTADGVVTAMHVFIYATELYVIGADEEDCGKGNFDISPYISWTQGAGSSFMNFWNGSTNLNYYLDYEYPLGRDGWGSTSDQQALSDGAKIDIHLIKSKTASGSQYMLFEAEGVKDYYEIDPGKSVTLTLKQTNSSFNGSSAPIIVPERDVYYISARDYAGQPVGDNNWTKLGTTNENGQITVPSDLASGTYYFSVIGEDNGSTERGPAAFVLKVKRAATDYTLGDVNGDGEVDSVDAVLVLKHTAGTLNNAEFITAAADVSGDGAADSTDAVLILKYAAGTITKFPAE